MITKETCYKVWICYHEIEKAEKLIQDMKESLAKGDETKLLDAFGRKQGLQLGIPSGDNGHRLFDVPPDLAIDVIDAHIAQKKKELIELEAIVKIEMR